MDFFWLIVLVTITLIECAIVAHALGIRNEVNSGSIFGTRFAETIWTLMPLLLVVALAFFSYDFIESQ